MEVCYQLPVLPLDRPVPKHVLGRRGAICINSSSGLFGGSLPRQLSKRRGAVSYDSSDQMALYIRMIDVRLRVQTGYTSEQSERDEWKDRQHANFCTDFRPLHSRTDTVTSEVELQPVRSTLSIHKNLHASYYHRNDTHDTHPTLDQEYIKQAKCMLQKVGSWNFDIFFFDQLSNGETPAGNYK
ncbi:hypothetical protein PDJAM_G00124690 [Pangasius djambal]|uniref:Uncharacterized protein n=1 Tax=Pangasius djambal TaxID=1691987 RepID=A0ACC5ZBI9_9TELE|nr:hypothetical protein [Pangasius djambal]